MKVQIQLLAILLFWVLAIPSVQADNSKMTHIVFQFEDSDIPEGHFALAPKEMWRLGNRYLRMEEAPDPKHGIHGLVIADEPHIYIINRYNNQAQHIVDPGPTFEIHMPIFPSRPKKGEMNREKEISKLEFGNELEFFKQRKSRRMPNVLMKGKNYNAFMLTIDGADLFLFTDKTSGQPVQLTIQSEKESFVVHYEIYESGLKPDMELFKVPEGLKIIEAKGQPIN